MEPNIGVALLLPVLAGLATTIGSTLGFFVQRPGPRAMSLSLGFAAGVMILVSFSELLPHGVEVVGFLWGYVAFFAGMAAMFAIDVKIPTSILPSNRTGNLAHWSLTAAPGVGVGLAIVIASPCRSLVCSGLPS